MRPFVQHRLPAVALAATSAILFLLVLGAFTGAAPTGRTVIEGESLVVLDAGGTAITRSSKASGGKALEFRAPRAARATVRGQVEKLVVHARGSECEGRPRLAVYLDGRKLGVEAIGRKWSDYEFSARSLDPGAAHLISVVFTRDRVTATCDRNVEVDRVTALKSGEPVAERAAAAVVVKTGTAVEAETLEAVPSTAAQLIGDNAATGTKARGFYSRGTLQFETTSSISSVAVRVKSTQCQGETPLSLFIDGEPYGPYDVTWGGWSTIWVNLPKALPAMSSQMAHTVQFWYGADFSNASCDRNLFYDWVGINLPTSYNRPPPVEAETLSRNPAAAGNATADNKASAGYSTVLWSPGAVNLPVKTGLWTTTVKLKGSQCAGAPTATILIDGTPYASFDVYWTGWKTYSVKLTASLTTAGHTVSVQFSNDYANGTCDRNLYIDWIGANLDESYLVDNPEPQATTAPVVVNRNKLKWSAPVLSNPETITLGTGEEYVRLDTTRDYIVKLPNRMRDALTLKGGRNVVVIGGAIRKQQGATLPRALMIDGATGTVHLEGILIDNTGGPEGDGVAINAPAATVQMENMRIVGISGSNSGDHGDIVQPFGGVKALRIDRLSGQTGCQGLFLPPSPGDIGSIALSNVDLNYVNNRVNQCGDLLWLTTDQCQSAPTTLSQVYVGDYLNVLTPQTSVWPKPWDAGCPSRATATSITFPGLPVTGSVTIGKPVGGPFVPSGLAGTTYVSPGYQ